MSADKELAYIQGSRMAWLTILEVCLKNLGINDPPADHLRWVTERELTVNQLREICKDYGDNDWPSNLALCDILRKHLLPYLPEREEVE